MTDYATWLTKQQAAAQLGVSTKTVEQFAKDGKLEQAVWKRPTGGPPLAVFSPESVAELALVRQPGPPAPFLVPTSDHAKPGSNGHGHGGTITRPAPPWHEADAQRSLASGFSALAAALQSLTPQATSESSQKLTTWIEIPEAAGILGRSEAYVRRRIKDGTLHAERDRRLKVRRTDVEAL